MNSEHPYNKAKTSSRELQQRDDKRRRKKEKYKKERKGILGFLFWAVTFYRALGIVNMESPQGRTVG